MIRFPLRLVVTACLLAGCASAARLMPSSLPPIASGNARLPGKIVWRDLVTADLAVSEPRAGVAVLELNGEHDVWTQPELSDLLCTLIRGRDLVVVDTTNATFVDSSFIQGLLIANAEAAARGVTFRVQVGPAPLVRRAIEISRVGDYIQFVETRGEALSEPHVRVAN